MKINTDKNKIAEILTRGAEEIIERESLKKKLESGKQLRIKFGIDPTGSELHLGHAVPLQKLRQFQNLGHQIILLIGDYTAMIGDPTGRNESRPILSVEKIKENMKTYVRQASKILNINKLEIKYNSEWYGKPNFSHLLMELTSKITVARVLERDDFQKRLKEGSDIQMQEILYPLLQGYDSVALLADVELGGADQKFNMLMGRKIQKRYNQEEQDIITVPLLIGMDGKKKMSKSYGNYIALLDSPEEMFGKIMSIADSLIISYFELCTGVSIEEIEKYKKELTADKNPRDIKMILGKKIVKLYHSEHDAKQAEDYFIKTFSQKETPTEMLEIKPRDKNILAVLSEAKFAKSKSDARRLVKQGGVKINDKKVSSIDAIVKSGDIIQKGSRFFARIG